MILQALKVMRYKKKLVVMTRVDPGVRENEARSHYSRDICYMFRYQAMVRIDGE